MPQSSTVRIKGPGVQNLAPRSWGCFDGPFTSGNRCGFVWENPRIAPGIEAGKQFLRRVQEAVCVFFYERDSEYYLGRKRWRNKDRGLYHKYVVRPERAEAIVIVLQFWVARLELSNLKIRDYPRKHGCSLSTICTETGLSRDRVKGAIHDLKSMGYVGGHQPKEIKNGKWNGRIAERWLTKKFFEVLGLLKSLRRLRKRPMVGEDDTRNENAVALVGDLVGMKATKSHHDEQREHELRRLEFEVGHQHPSWTPAQVTDHAKALLRRSRG